MENLNEIILAVDNESKLNSKPVFLNISCFLALLFCLAGLFFSVISLLFSYGNNVGENLILVKPLIFYTFGGKTFIVINIFLCVLSLVSVFLLWKKSHKGLWFFILSQLALTFIPFFFLKWGFVPLLANLYPIFTVSFLLIFLFLLNYKRLY